MKTKLLVCAVLLAGATVSRAAAFESKVKEATGVDPAAKVSSGDVSLPADYGYLDRASVVADADGKASEIRLRKEFPSAHSQEAVVAVAESTLKKVQGDFSVSGSDDAPDGTAVWRKKIRFSDVAWTAVLAVAKDGDGRWTLSLVFCRN